MLTEELLKRLDLLAAKLNTTANALWQVLVNQAHVEAMINATRLGISVGFLVGGLGFGLWMLKKAIHEDNRPLAPHGDTRQTEFYGIPAVILAFVSLGGLVGTLSYATDWVTPFFNPQYWALQQILNTLK